MFYPSVVEVFLDSDRSQHNPNPGGITMRQTTLMTCIAFMLSSSIVRAGVLFLSADGQECTPCAASYDNTGPWGDLDDMIGNLTCDDETGYCSEDCNKVGAQATVGNGWSLTVRCVCPNQEDVCYLNVKLVYSPDPMPHYFWVLTCKGLGTENLCDSEDAPEGCDDRVCTFTIRGGTTYFCKCKEDT